MNAVRCNNDCYVNSAILTSGSGEGSFSSAGSFVTMLIRTGPPSLLWRLADFRLSDWRLPLLSLPTQTHIHTYTGTLTYTRVASLITFSLSVFTARRHASAVCRSRVCLSVTSPCSTETAKRIMQTTPHDSQGTLVFWRQRSRQNSNGSPQRRLQMQVK